jgi:hypothetical protein
MAKKTQQSNDENTMGMLAHLLSIFSGFVGPLIIFLIRREQRGDGYENARHALNFRISLVIYYIAATIIIFGLFGILYFAIWVFSLVVAIIGTIRANQGDIYKYPLEIPFIK